MTMDSLPQRCVAEAIGTFAIVFFGCGSLVVLKSATHGDSHVAVNMAFGLVVAAMIYCFGHVSGAHFNPAVTLGLSTGGYFSWKDSFPYVLSQCSGAVLASVLHFCFLGEAATNAAFGATRSTIAPAPTMVLEGVLTFFLVLVIAGSAIDQRAPRGFAGLAIGFVVLVSGLFAGPITGNSLNPARSLAPALMSGQLGAVWPYVFGPIMGGVLAVQTYKFMRAPGVGHSGPNAASEDTNPGTSRRKTETVSK